MGSPLGREVVLNEIKSRSVIHTTLIFFSGAFVLGKAVLAFSYFPKTLNKHVSFGQQNTVK